MIRIVHVIPSLDTGGAEIMLSKLVASMDRRCFLNTVVSLTDRGQLGAVIQSSGVEVCCLGMKRRRLNISALPRFIRLLKTLNPTIVQSWLYHADLLSLMAVRFAGSPSLVWNVRCSDMELAHYPFLTRLVRWVLPFCSSLPAAVVVNSLAGQRQHERLGYHPRRWKVIPNGFDTDRFRPDRFAGQRLRKELGLAEDTMLLALVARLDPMKDHATFLAAASQVAAARANVHFLLAGKDTERLAPRVAELGLIDRVHLLGLRHDIDRLIPAVDIACLSSAFGEGFPNVLGEAMAAGVPCVTTDVGDARVIVDRAGLVVPPRDSRALTMAMLDLIDRGSDARRELGRAARARIEDVYSLPIIVQRYCALYSDLAVPHHAPH